MNKRLGYKDIPSMEEISSNLYSPCPICGKLYPTFRIAVLVQGAMKKGGLVEVRKENGNCGLCSK